MIMSEFKSKIENSIEEEDDLQKIVEGRDINIVVRARPLLEYEVKENYFDITHAQNKSFYFFEPKISVKELS
jgi:kinesin family protein 2/24